jgi:hypothetical protein
MLNWLRSLFNRYGFPLAGIWNDFINVLISVQAYDENTFAWISSWITYLYSDFTALNAALWRFVLSTYLPFVNWVQQQLFNMEVREHQDYTQIGNDIAALQNRTNQQIQVTQQTASDGLLGLIKWIISFIFDPLNGLIGRALSWIATEGAYILGLLSSADKLLAWLLKWLLSDWNTLLDKFGKLALSWFLANWRHAEPLVLSTLEDIIARILLGEHYADRASVPGRGKARPAHRHARVAGDHLHSRAATRT